MNKVQSSKQKPDYQKQLELIIQENQGKKPSLLLHACCAPCSSYVIEYLAKFFDITIYYYNPNIHPQAEYERRLEELKNFLPRFPEAIQNKVQLVEAAYDPEDYFAATNVRSETELQDEAERGERCRRCYLLRMEKSRQYAVQHGYDYFTTTLSISPYKDSFMINDIGLSFSAEELKGTRYLPADFKKKGGFLRSTQISSEYGLWRQDYCGCIYSKINEEKRRAQKKDPSTDYIL